MTAGEPVDLPPDRFRFARRLALLLLVAIVQFGIFEAGLRMWGSSEAAPAFQGLFENDPIIGYRLKPNARVRFTTTDFDTNIRINSSGVRDDEELGRKPPDERRIVILGDSLVLSVQVPFEQTFGELLEAALNRRATGVRYRVVNAGVQGYGPIEEMLWFRRLGPALEPDLVMTVVFVGNDAEDAVASRGKIAPQPAAAPATVANAVITRLRRLVRRSMVLQIVRLRIVAATARFRSLTPPEPPLQSYAAHPAPRIAEGLAETRHAIEDIVANSSKLGARSAIVLMPARFQVDDEDYRNLREIVTATGGALLRDGATARFAAAMEQVHVPRVDVLPALRAALPGPLLFFQTTVHLTPRGHRVVADALAAFIDREHLLKPEKDTR
jgi:lysophospholipase L1-like esterase